MATKAKKTAPKRASKKKNKPGSNNAAYVRLRTVLDSLEIGAIRYFASAPTAAQKQERMEEMERALMAMIRWLWSVGGAETIDCPEGYTDCNGVCVPYPCPDL